MIYKCKYKKIFRLIRISNIYIKEYKSDYININKD